MTTATITKTICPNCKERDDLPLVYGNLDLIDEEPRAMVLRGEMVCGGDAISILENGHIPNMTCLSCRWEWFDVDRPSAY